MTTTRQIAAQAAEEVKTGILSMPSATHAYELMPSWFASIIERCIAPVVEENEKLLQTIVTMQDAGYPGLDELDNLKRRAEKAENYARNQIGLKTLETFRADQAQSRIATLEQTVGRLREAIVEALPIISRLDCNPLFYDSLNKMQRNLEAAISADPAQ